MKDKYQCPDCMFKRMTKLKLLERWWCSFCNAEKDIEKTIQQWAKSKAIKEEE